MDVPRQRSPDRGRAVIVGLLAVAVVAGYGPLKRAGVDLLELGGRAGAAWLRATPEPSSGQTALAAEPFTLAFGVDGNLKFPNAYREWVFVGSATGLAYGETSATRRRGDRNGQDHPGVFTQVYLEPGAYHHFRQTGQFKEGTTFALEMREPTTGVSIAGDGWFAGDLQGIHAAIKDTERFGGWAYFNVDTSGVARRVGTPACGACHAEHGAIDNVFVQFYPPLTEAASSDGH